MTDAERIAQSYTLEMRWKYIRAEIDRRLNDGERIRPGHLANAYGGGFISKLDVMDEVRRHTELGGDGK